MANEPLISVVIATYNGSKYLPEQLNSIFNQTYQNIEVIVCDDNSTDNTEEILQYYQKKNGLRYYINEKKQGVIKNFENGISRANGVYIALSDQDDVWLPGKLELSFEKLKEIEREGKQDSPALVFSDLHVVDERLDMICASYWSFMKLNPQNTQLNSLLVENVMTGCTALMNRATLNLALPIPKEALMHDIWILLVASSFGRVGYLSEQTVLYRQHSQNVIGAHQKGILDKLKSGFNKFIDNELSLLDSEIKQAEAFYNHYNQLLAAYPDKKVILEKFISLKKYNFFKRKWSVIKYGFYGSTISRAINVVIRA